jgi:hypothetical protein
MDMHPSIERARGLLGRRHEQEDEHALWLAEHDQEIADADVAAALEPSDLRAQALAESRARFEANRRLKPRAAPAMDAPTFCRMFDARVKGVIRGVARKVVALNKTTTDEIAALHRSQHTPR